MGIRFNCVCKRFGPKIILNDVSFEVSDGEILFILGKSGAGKSVTLKHIVGVLKPDSGSVFVGDTNVSILSDEALTAVRRQCGMVFQHPALLDSLTVYQNVSFGLRTPQYLASLERPLTENEIQKIVIEKLSLVNLGSDVLDKMPSFLLCRSVGE